MKKKGRRKDLSYDRYEQYMKNEISNHVKNRILTHVTKYKFSGKMLHLLKVEANIFKSESISQKMKDVNLLDVIKTATSNFFS